VKHLVAVVGLAMAFGVGPYRNASAAEPVAQPGAAAPRMARVYGEWRIHVRPDKTSQYARLIDTEGLPLFREAGGRMVGWWTTSVGDLYEHITIWEYDNMAGFEQAGQKLGKDKRFAEFTAKRDPLLAGEENRFLHLAGFAADPALPELAKIVVHEVHRVPLSRRDGYLKFIEGDDGLALLKRHGFRPVGPWIVGVGNWSEVTYLFCFDSLREREELMAAFAGQAEARHYGGKLNEYAEEVTTRILVPAKFAQRPADGQP
jgi:NIPSNAP